MPVVKNSINSVKSITIMKYLPKCCARRASPGATYTQI